MVTECECARPQCSWLMHILGFRIVATTPAASAAAAKVSDPSTVPCIVPPTAVLSLSFSASVVLAERAGGPLQYSSHPSDAPPINVDPPVSGKSMSPSLTGGGSATRRRPSTLRSSRMLCAILDCVSSSSSTVSSPVADEPANREERRPSSVYTTPSVPPVSSLAGGAERVPE